MKNLRILLIAFILLVSFLLPVRVFPQLFTKQREVSKSFKVREGTVLQVTNKYGNINVVIWQKDSIRLEVMMKVQGKQMAKVDKIMSSIDFEMMSFGNYVNARTSFRDNQATFWKDVVSYASQVINTTNNLQIDYTVYMPSSLDLKIDNKFGNIYTESHSGNVDIKLANGDFQARDFTGTLKLYIEFGTATFGNLDQANLEINYSDLTLNKANSLNINSRSSNIFIEKVKSIDLSSHRDKINFKECTSISGEASFSKIHIAELTASCTLTTKYGELKLNAISRNFRSVHLNSEYTNHLMNFDPFCAFTLDMSYDEKTRLTISPQLNALLKKATVGSTPGTINASASFGKAPNSFVYLSAKAGSIAIFNK